MGSLTLPSQHLRSSEINSFNMNVNVEFAGNDPIPVKNVKTVGELKQKLRETEGTDFQFRDFDKYKLFQGGVELDDPTKLLEKLAQGGEGITLVKPEEVKGSREGGPAYPLMGSQEIGLIKKVIRINDNERKVECISYDVKAHGKIFIWKTDDQMET